MIVTNFVQETANGANNYVSIDNENGLISIMLKATYDAQQAITLASSNSSTPQAGA
jgi:hypothetical protein